MSASIGFRVLRQMVPDEVGRYLERGLKQSGQTRVDAATLKAFLPRIPPRDPSRAVIEKFVRSLEATDALAAAAQEANVEVDPFEAFHLKKSGADGAPDLRSLGQADALVDLWSNKAAPSPAVEIPPTEDGAEPTYHPLDQSLADLLSPPPGFVKTVCDALSVRMFDGAWIQSGAAKTTAGQLAKAGIPIYESLFEHGTEPGAIVFDKLGAPLDELVQRHSLRGRRPVVAVAMTKKPLTEEEQAHLSELGVKEIVHWRPTDAKALTEQVKATVDRWSGEQRDALENAVVTSGQPKSSEAWWAAVCPLAVALQGSTGPVLVQTDSRDDRVEWLGPFAGAMVGGEAKVYDASSRTDIGPYLGEAKGGALVISNAEHLTAENQAKLLTHLLDTTHRSVPRAQTIVASTTTSLDHAVAIGRMNKELARVLGGSTVRMPSLRTKPSELVGIAQELLARAYEGAGEADGEKLRAVKSLSNKAVAAYIGDRYSKSWYGLTALMNAVRDQHASGESLTPEILQGLEPELVQRSATVDAVIAQLFDTPPDIRTRVDIAQLVELAEAKRSIVRATPEDQDQIIDLITTAKHKVAERDGTPVPEVTVFNPDEASLARLEGLADHDGRDVAEVLIIPDVEWFEDSLQARLFAALDAAQEAGTIGSAVFLSSTPPSEWRASPHQASMGATAPLFVAPFTTNADADASIGDATVQRPVRKPGADPAEIAAQEAAAEQTRLADAAKTIDERASSGQSFDELRAGQPDDVLAAMDTKMWTARYETWPDKMLARAERGQGIGTLLAQYREAAAALGKPENDPRVDKANETLAGIRLQNWPVQIRERVAGDEHFDDLLEEYRAAAKSAGAKVDTGFLDELHDAFRDRIKTRAEAGEDFGTYMAEYKASSKRQGGGVSKTFVAQMEVAMFEARLASWPAKIEEHASRGASFETLEVELRAAQKEMGKPIDEAWYAAQHQALKAAQ